MGDIRYTVLSHFPTAKIYPKKPQEHSDPDHTVYELLSLCIVTTCRLFSSLLGSIGDSGASIGVLVIRALLSVIFFTTIDDLGPSIFRSSQDDPRGMSHVAL